LRRPREKSGLWTSLQRSGDTLGAAKSQSTKNNERRSSNGACLTGVNKWSH